MIHVFWIYCIVSWTCALVFLMAYHGVFAKALVANPRWRGLDPFWAGFFFGVSFVLAAPVLGPILLVRAFKT
jgi:hypothetical protein